MLEGGNWTWQAENGRVGGAGISGALKARRNSGPPAQALLTQSWPLQSGTPEDDPNWVGGG